MAQILVRYSVAVKPGEPVLIHSTDLAAPLAREIYREALRAGGHPEVNVGVPGLAEPGVHWDMLCDMRDGGEIWADGRLIYQAGRFVLQ